MDWFVIEVCWHSIIEMNLAVAVMNGLRNHSFAELLEMVSGHSLQLHGGLDCGIQSCNRCGIFS